MVLSRSRVLCDPSSCHLGIVRVLLDDNARNAYMVYPVEPCLASEVVRSNERSMKDPCDAECATRAPADAEARR